MTTFTREPGCKCREVVGDALQLELYCPVHREEARAQFRQSLPGCIVCGAERVPLTRFCKAHTASGNG